MLYTPAPWHFDISVIYPQGSHTLKCVMVPPYFIKQQNCARVITFCYHSRLPAEWVVDAVKIRIFRDEIAMKAHLATGHSHKSQNAYRKYFTQMFFVWNNPSVFCWGKNMTEELSKCFGCWCCVAKCCQVISWHAIYHYNGAIMGAMASQITSLTIVYSTVYSGAD